MERNYFTQYIDDINKIALEAREKYTKVSTALVDTQQAANAARIKYPVGDNKRIVAEASYKEAEAGYKRAVNDIQDELGKGFQNLRKTLLKHIAEYTAADPGKVDQNSIALLNSGAMTASDLVALANKHWNNPTMLKLVSAQAQKMPKENRIAGLLTNKIEEYISPEVRLNVFDTAVSCAQRTIQQDGYSATGFQKMWDNEFYEKMKSHMARFDTFSVNVGEK